MVHLTTIMAFWTITIMEAYIIIQFITTTIGISVHIIVHSGVAISQIVTIGGQGHIGEAIKDLEDPIDLEEFINQM